MSRRPELLQRLLFPILVILLEGCAAPRGLSSAKVALVTLYPFKDSRKRLLLSNYSAHP